MPARYTDTWDEIQTELVQYASDPQSTNYQLARAAFEIKSAIETIEQQKRIAELQQHLIAQQQENVSYTRNLSEYQRESTYYSGNLVQQQRRLVWPTRILAFFTLALFVATAAYVGVNYLDWQSSREQIAAIERFSEIWERQETSLRNLSQSLRLIPNSISDFSESVHALQSIQKQVDTLREDYQKLEENQKRVMKKLKLKVE
jgi:hypothetical protein